MKTVSPWFPTAMLLSGIRRVRASMGSIQCEAKIGNATHCTGAHDSREMANADQDKNGK